jgi:hypothetical protein
MKMLFLPVPLAPVPQVFFSHKALPALALVYLSRPKAPEQAHTLWLTYW